MLNIAYTLMDIDFFKVIKNILLLATVHSSTLHCLLLVLLYASSNWGHADLYLLYNAMSIDKYPIQPHFKQSKPSLSHIEHTVYWQEMIPDMVANS